MHQKVSRRTEGSAAVPKVCASGKKCLHRPSGNRFAVESCPCRPLRKAEVRCLYRLLEHAGAKQRLVGKHEPVGRIVGILERLAIAAVFLEMVKGIAEKVVTGLFKRMGVFKDCRSHGKAGVYYAVPVMVEVTLVYVPFAGNHTLLPEGGPYLLLFRVRKKVPRHIQADCRGPGKMGRLQAAHHGAAAIIAEGRAGPVCNRAAHKVHHGIVEPGVNFGRWLYGMHQGGVREVFGAVVPPLSGGLGVLQAGVGGPFKGAFTDGVKKRLCLAVKLPFRLEEGLFCNLAGDWFPQTGADVSKAYGSF